MCVYELNMKCFKHFLNLVSSLHKPFVNIFINILLGQKPHECKKCGKRFALGCNMKAHMKTHENPSSKFNISLYSPTTNIGESNRMEENEEDLGEDISSEETSEIVN